MSGVIVLVIAFAVITVAIVCTWKNRRGNPPIQHVGKSVKINRVVTCNYSDSTGLS